MGASLESLSEGADSSVLSSVLTDPRQRRLLAVLSEETQPVTRRDLAARTVALEAQVPASDVREDDVRRLLVALHHRYLPKLEAIGWIERHPEGIVTTERFPAGEAGFSRLPEAEPDPGWDALAALLARPRRQRIVSILSDRGRLPFADLVDELAARDGPPRPADGDEPALPAILHHVDLPRLEEAGLVEYDLDARTVAPGHALAAIEDWCDVIDAGTDAGSES